MTLTPYPRFGECIRFLAGGFDSKSSDRDVDLLARKGDFDWSLLDGVIEELLVHGTKAVMGPTADSVLRPWLLKARDEYTQIILSAGLDSIGRAQSLPVLMEHFFLPKGAELLRRLHDALPGPDLADLLDGTHSPVDVVFSWLEKKISEPIGKLLYPASTDADKVSRDKISKWRNGTDTPSLQGIKLLFGRLSNEPRGKEYAGAFTRWLLIASALSRFDQKFATSIRPQILAAVQRPHDIAALVNSLEGLVRKAGADWPEMADEGRRLWFDLRRTSAKNVGDQQGLWHRIEQIERLANQLDPAGMTAYHYAWMKARWHVLSGLYDEAIPHYKIAFELATYRAGHAIKDLVEEGLCLAAFLGNKAPVVKQFKHVSIALALFIRPHERPLVEKWEFEQFAQRLLVLFPPDGRFPESPQELSQSPIPGFKVMSAVVIDAMKLDPKKPDRVHTVTFSDGSVRRWPQLRLFASFGKDSQVRDLLARGASVDELDSSGGSALLCAIQHAEGSGNQDALNLLLKAQHLPATLNAQTHRKRLTPLMCAIDLGTPDVVQALLEKGADADLVALTDNQSPLYYSVSRLFARAQPQAFMKQLIGAFLTAPDQVQQETLRRFGVVSAGVFGSDITLAQANPALVLQLARIQVDQYVKRHSISSLTQIVKLLLEHEAKPNRPHGYPVVGRTPMMLAAESDLPEVLHMMMEHGGEPRQPDGYGQNSLQIADSFGARRAAAYLRSVMR